MIVEYLILSVLCLGNDPIRFSSGNLWGSPKAKNMWLPEDKSMGFPRGKSMGFKTLKSGFVWGYPDPKIWVLGGGMAAQFDVSLPKNFPRTCVLLKHCLNICSQTYVHEHVKHVEHMIMNRVSGISLSLSLSIYIYI